MMSRVAVAEGRDVGVSIRGKAEGSLRRALSALTVLVASACGGDSFSQGSKPQFEVAVEGAIVTSVLEGLHEFQKVQPGTGQRQKAEITLRNNGTAPVTISRVTQLDVNADGTAKSKWMVLDWRGFDPALGLPLTIAPGDSPLKIDMVYEPGAACEAENNCESSATIEILTDDPAVPKAVIEFALPKCRREPKVYPPSDIFLEAEVGKPEIKTFTVENSGTCACTVNSVKMVGGANVFTLTQDFADGTELKPNASPVSFTVTYTSAGGAGTDQTQIQVEFDCQSQPTIIPITTQAAQAGNFEVSYDEKETKGFLDFTTVAPSTCEEKVVSIYNVGPAIMTVQTREVPEDLQGNFYTVTCAFPPAQEGAEPTPVTGNAALAAGRTLECTVKYCATDAAGKNGTLTIAYVNPGPGTIEVPMFGGTPKPCFDFGPGDVSSQMALDFVATAKGEAVDGRFMIYNCGNADLEVKAVRVEDAFGQGEASEYFTVDAALAFPLTVPVGGVQSVELTMVVNDNEPQVSSTMYIDYVDGSGATLVASNMNVRGFVAPTVPVIAAALEASGEKKVGKELTLSGAASTPASEIGEGAYAFYLVDKPAGSQLIINGSPGDATRDIIPDKAGKYVFALRVFAKTEPYIWSPEATVEVDVTE